MMLQEYQQAAVAVVQPWPGEGLSLLPGAAGQTTLQADHFHNIFTSGLTGLITILN